MQFRKIEIPRSADSNVFQNQGGRIPTLAALVLPERPERQAAGLLPVARLAQAGPQAPGLLTRDTEPRKPANPIHPLNSACSVLKRGGERVSGAGLSSRSPKRQHTR